MNKVKSNENTNEFLQFINKLRSKIGRLRTVNNISARKLSFEFGKSKEYVNQIENGHSLPNIEFLFFLSQYFSIKISDLLDETNDYPKELNTLFETFKKLKGDELNTLLSVANIIANK
jgi:transcriptional regulator with XRE-family HTH domain